MRARRLSRLAGLVLALAVTLGVVAGWSGGFTTMEYEWGGPSVSVSTSGAPPQHREPALQPRPDRAWPARTQRDARLKRPG